MTYEAAAVQARRHNIDRFRRLLATPLTIVERQYVHRRLAEEQDELDRLFQKSHDNIEPRALAV